jgi:cytochrome P450
MGCFNHVLSDDCVQLVQASKLLFNAYQKLYYGFPLWKWIPTKAYKQLDEAESLIYKVVESYIDRAIRKDTNENRKHYNGGNEEEGQTSILNALLKLEKLSLNDIKVTIIDFIAGGIFTMGNAINFIVYHLAKNPQIQVRLAQDLNRILRRDGTNNEEMKTNVTSADLAQMTYLRACIKESFRLTCTIPGIMRILPNDVTLSGYKVPAGTPIFANFLVANTSDNNFKDPQRFRPERWLNDERKEINPFVLLPFGHGNRMCAGRRFAQLQLEMVIAHIVRAYYLKMQPKDEIGLEFSFMVIPDRQIQIEFEPRNA